MPDSFLIPLLYPSRHRLSSQLNKCKIFRLKLRLKLNKKQIRLSKIRKQLSKKLMHLYQQLSQSQMQRKLL
jgi:hypothetical protein